MHSGCDVVTPIQIQLEGTSFIAQTDRQSNPLDIHFHFRRLPHVAFYIAELLLMQLMQSKHVGRQFDARAIVQYRSTAVVSSGS